jgi:hypothetical protein
MYDRIKYITTPGIKMQLNVYMLAEHTHMLATNHSLAIGDVSDAIQKKPGYCLGLWTILVKFTRCFLQFLQANATIVHPIRPLFSLINYSLGIIIV